MNRVAGMLLAVSSLPSKHGIGDFGEKAYEFIDLLQKSNIKIWQILPLNPLGFGNSPYQPYSSKAMDELYISLDLLFKDGLLKEEAPAYRENESRVDYDLVRKFKRPYLEEAYKNLKRKIKLKAEFKSWCEENKWVDDYAIFLTFKKENDLQMWVYWREDMKNYIHDKKMDLKPYEDKINLEKFIQFILFRQWAALKAYANSKGIQMMGDVPFYVGIDSLDVWGAQEDFLLDGEGNPTSIAGVPPDYFSATGQRWGNPIYNWEKMKKDHFKFWMERLGFAANVFDIIRIDHFRAFDTYWKIPASCPTAIDGEWLEAPGYELFDELYKNYPNINIVAEDLGDLFDSVLVLRDHYNLPGMNVLQFTFDITKYEYGEKDRYNQLVYTGTHDNQTIKGWVESLTEDEFYKLRNKLNRLNYYDEDIVRCFVNLALDNKANYAIIPMQDFLELGDEAKMNTPGTVGSPDWEWKLVDFKAFEEKIPWIAQRINETNRNN